MMALIENESDFLTVALKGQLYAEYWLNEAILTAWGNGASKIVDEFAFPKKLVIVEGTGLITNRPLLDTLRAISEIRNAIAHNFVVNDPFALSSRLPRFPKDPNMENFAPEHFSDRHEWALVYLKVSIITACIPLIGHYYLPKKPGGEPARWMAELKKIALDKLRPQSTSKRKRDRI